MALQAPLHEMVRDMAGSIHEMMACMESKAQDIRNKSVGNIHFLEKEIAKLYQVSESLSSLDNPRAAEDIVKEEQELCALDKEISETTQEIFRLQQKVKEAETELAGSHQQLQNLSKPQPRARYAVNLYRQVSQVRWHTGQPANEVRGFIHGKSVKTFSFDEHKQSRYFITNSLWEMGEEEVW